MGGISVTGHSHLASVVLETFIKRFDQDIGRARLVEESEDTPFVDGPDSNCEVPKAGEHDAYAIGTELSHMPQECQPVHSLHP